MNRTPQSNRKDILGYLDFSTNLNDLLAFLEDVRCAMLCQTLVKELDRLFVLLLLKIGVTNPGICPAKGQEEIDFVHTVKSTKGESLKLTCKTFTLLLEIDYSIRP